MHPMLRGAPGGSESCTPVRVEGMTISGNGSDSGSRTHPRWWEADGVGDGGRLPGITNGHRQLF